MKNITKIISETSHIKPIDFPLLLIHKLSRTNICVDLVHHAKVTFVIHKTPRKYVFSQKIKIYINYSPYGI